MQKSELFKMLKHVASVNFNGVASIEIDTDSPREGNNDVYLIKNGKQAVLSVEYEPYGEFVGFKILDAIEPTVNSVSSTKEYQSKSFTDKVLWLDATTWEDAFRSLYDPRKRKTQDAVDNIQVVQQMILRLKKNGWKMTDNCTENDYSIFHKKVRANISSTRCNNDVLNGLREKRLSKGRPKKSNIGDKNDIRETNQSKVPFL
jgi:hypothetical protein